MKTNCTLILFASLFYLPFSVLAQGGGVIVTTESAGMTKTGGMMGTYSSGQVSGGQGMMSGSANSNGTVSNAKSAMNKVMNLLPDGESKRGLKEYTAILGLEKYGSDMSVGGSNSGISTYFTQRYTDKKNSCVRDAAKKFYEDVAAYLKSRGGKCPPSEKKSKGFFMAMDDGSFPDYGCGVSRPQLSDAAGAGKFEKYEPGWAWRLALKNANNDPNAALFLIGMCGHDDMIQGDYANVDTSPTGEDTARFQAEQWQETVKRKQSRLNELKAQNSDYQRVILESTDLQNEILNLKARIEMVAVQGGLNTRMMCPPGGSGYYAAKSLGAEADIPEALKHELKNTFSSDNAKNTASKYYHVYGSAFMACQLVQNGYSPASASLLQQQAARVYRGIRMCQSTKGLERDEEAHKKIQEKIFAKYKVSDDFSLGKLFLGDPKKIEQCRNGTASEECSYLMNVGIPIYALGGYSNEFEITDDYLRSALAGRAKGLDASKLYKSWYLGGGEVAGKQIPCSDLRVLGPTDLQKPTESFFGRIAKPSGWTAERYKIASQKLATWDADYKWTIAQHKAGADFAGKVCKKRDPKEKPLKGICPDGPPDGKTRHTPGSNFKNKIAPSNIVQ